MTKMIFAIIIVMISSAGFARPIIHKTTTNTIYRGASSKHFIVDDMQYDLSFSGIENYLDDLEYEGHNELVDRIYPHFEELKAARRTSVLVASPFLISSIYLLYKSVSYKDRTAGIHDIGHPNFLQDDTQEVADQYGRKAGVLALFGVTAWLALSPGRTDFLEFIRHHNRESRDLDLPSLQFRLGFENIKSPSLLLSWDI